ncbi:MAG TPA: L-threonylcarbamoyladenylate synthase [Blastocatellia bacterium]|nr:L-threonylcarbamoyladenylate synthase [Blastocatellia bacterium]
MTTTVLTESPQQAAHFIREGEVVAFPTETVYGLGANLFDEAAIRKIFASKGRPADNPLIAHVADLSQLRLVARDVTRAAQKFIAAFFPGPLTVLLPKSERVPLLATAGLETVGVRIPRHPVAREFLSACGVPVAAPSANLSGRPSPTTWETVQADLDGRISCILKGDQTEVGLESTVVDCTGVVPVVLRAGAITLERLREVIPETRLSEGGAGELPKSPGLKYRHYAPQAGVVLVAQPHEASPAANAAYIGIGAHPQAASFGRHRACDSVEDYARALFLFFRQCDAAGIGLIYCQAVTEAGLGLALMDRIRRAAEKHEW